MGPSVIATTAQRTNKQAVPAQFLEMVSCFGVGLGRVNLSWRFQFLMLFQKDFAKFWWFWRLRGGLSRKNLGIRLKNFYYFLSIYNVYV